MFKFRAYQIVLHIAGWLLFMAFPLLFINGGQDDLALMLSKPFYWLFCGTYVFLFYLNSYVLVPNLFLKKKYGINYAVLYRYNNEINRSFPEVFKNEEFVVLSLESL